MPNPPTSQLPPSDREEAAETGLSARERVYRRLRREITTGQLAPGERLVYRKIAARLGTSPIPVIEAVRRLEGNGLLTSLDGCTQVRRWRPEEYEDLFYIRAVHEGAACRLFAQRATDEDFELAEEYCRQYDAASDAGDVEAASDADLRLHFHIARAARSPELLRLVEHSGLIFITLSNATLPPALRSARLKLKATAPSHWTLLAALRSRNPEEAERVGRQHVYGEGFHEHLQEYLAGVSPFPPVASP